MSLLPFPHETLKYNIDADWKSQFSRVAISVVVRNSNSVLVDEVAKRIWSYYPLVVEVRAVLKTL